MADRNPSKKRRQAQNRAERAERAARAEAAKSSSDERRESRAPDPVARKKRPARDETEYIESERAPAQSEDTTKPTPTASTKVRGGVFSSRRKSPAETSGSSRPPRTANAVAAATGTPARVPAAPKSEAAAPARGSGATKDVARAASGKGSAAPSRASARPVRPLPPWLDRFGGNEPGGRWVLLSFATILLASVVLSFVHIVPERIKNSKGKWVDTGTTYTIWHFGFVRGLVYLLPPIIVVGLSIVLGARSDRRRHWNTALVLLIMITFLLGAVQLFLVPILCLGWGCWLARRAALAEYDGDAQALRLAERQSRYEARARRKPRKDEPA